LEYPLHNARIQTFASENSYRETGWAKIAEGISEISFPIKINVVFSQLLKQNQICYG
jgi:hypothetical protein